MTSDFSGGPGFLAFVVTFALVVALILLVRSLSSHLRKVRTHPPESGEAHSTGDRSSGAQSTGIEEDDGTRDEVADEPGDR